MAGLTVRLALIAFAVLVLGVCVILWSLRPSMLVLGGSIGAVMTITRLVG